VEVWVKPLDKGDYAVALFNRGTTEAAASISWAELKLTGQPKVRDLWAHADKGRVLDKFESIVPAHGAVMIRVSR